MEHTWVILLRNTGLEPSYKILVHNLTQEAAKLQADEIQRQRVEGERVTLVRIMDGRETHEDCGVEDCDACYDLILTAHGEELEGTVEREMLKRGLTPFT